MIAFYNPESRLKKVKAHVEEILGHHCDDVVSTANHKLKFKHKFFSCDLLLLEGTHLSDRLPEDHDIFTPDLRGERELSESFLKGSSVDKQVTDDNNEYLSPKTTAYILRKMKQSRRYRQVARLAKFWGQITVRDEVFKSKSTILELLAIYVCDSLQHQLAYSSLDFIFREILGLLCNYRNVKFIVTDQFRGLLTEADIEDICSVSGPLIIDPGNPYNMFRTGDVPWESLQWYATKTLQRMDDPSATLVRDDIFYYNTISHKLEVHFQTSVLESNPT